MFKFDFAIQDLDNELEIASDGQNAVESSEPPANQAEFKRHDIKDIVRLSFLQTFVDHFAEKYVKE